MTNMKSTARKILSVRSAVRGAMIACLAALAFAAFAAPASAGEPIWKKIDRAQLVKMLEGGRVGFVDRGLYPGREMAVSGVLVNAKPEDVWKVITDFENYPKMINQFSKVEVIEKNEKFARIHFYMFIIKLGPVKVQTNYIQKWTFDKPKKITMTSGEPAKNAKKGKDIPITWELVPTPDGKRTMIFYTTISDMRDGGMIGSYMVDRQPTIQIGFDLANALTQTEAIKNQIEKKK
jgi:ribosome-associated toxin RatA of RatAB toxin-antitoxin module